MVTYQQTITADGNYDLSAIMKLAAHLARRRVEVGKTHRHNHGIAVPYASEFYPALKEVWAFARTYRDARRAEIAMRSWTPEQIEARSCLIAAELAETAIPPRPAEAIVNRELAVSLLSRSLMQEAA